jgi:hypothetical protein
MEIQGRVHNGVVIPERELSLPEGTLVTVVYPVSQEAQPRDSARRVRLPMVRSDRPGSRQLDAERVGELLWIAMTTQLGIATWEDWGAGFRPWWQQLAIIRKALSAR